MDAKYVARQKLYIKGCLGVSTTQSSTICPQYCSPICEIQYLYTETESKLALAVLRGITKRQVADTLLPCLTWMRGYDLWRVLPCDMISGLSVGLMVVPQGLSYAGLVGVPPEYGLYAGMAKPLWKMLRLHWIQQIVVL
jgi:hypothetical protein